MPQENHNPFVTLAKAIHAVDPQICAELESRILANQPQHAIAFRTGIPIEAIVEFESRFFNIRHRLDDREWIWKEVIGGQMSDPIDPLNCGRLWRCTAYNPNPFGILELEMILACVDREKLKKEGVSAYLKRNVRLPLDLKFRIARACCPLLHTDAGMKRARALADLRNWQQLLPKGESETGVFARFVSLLHMAVQKKARRRTSRL